MGLELPNSGNVFLPAVPSAESLQNPVVLHDTLRDMNKLLEEMANALFSNDLHIATTINSGTSGTFTLSSGGSIVITSGIVLNVTS